MAVSPSPILRPPTPFTTETADATPTPRLIRFPALPPATPEQGRSTFVSISMTPPAESEEKERVLDLTKEEEEEQDADDPFSSRFAVAVREAGSMSSAEDTEERFEAVREQMGVWVPAGEKEGMPTTEAEDPLAQSQKSAVELTRGFTSGAMGFLRRRKTVSKPAAQDQKVGDEETGPAETATPSLVASGGILAALIALSAQPDSIPDLPDSSLPSPGGTMPTTPGGSSLFDPDDSDDEVERELFISRLRARRASKNALHAASNAVTEASRVALSLAKGRPRSVDGRPQPFRRNTSSSSLSQEVFARSPSPTPSRDTQDSRNSAPSTPYRSQPPSTTSALPPRSPSSPPAPAHSPPFTSRMHRSHSASALHTLVASVSRASSPSPPPSPGVLRPRVVKPGAGVAKQLRRLGGHLGLEVDTEATRPDAARSGAGVFGGLVMSTSNLAGAAAPHANVIAPIPSKAGYHISRYKAPSPKPPEAPSRRTSESPHRQPMTRPGILRGKSVDSVFKSEMRSESPIFRLDEEGEEDEGRGNGAAEQGEEEERGRTGRPAPKRKGPGMQLTLKDLPIPGFRSHSLTSPRSRSPRNDSPLRDYFFPHGHETEEEQDQREWAKEKRKRRKIKEKRMRQEIFITQHVAALLARQEFILKLARSFMMYGSPTHRLEAQIQATARVLELELQCVYLPGLMLISFGDSQTHTSDIKFLKQAQGLDLGKMEASFGVYNKVIRDKVSVTDAAVNLDELFLAPAKYTLWQDMLIGGLASASVIPSGYKGSFIDCLVAIPLGAFLIYAQRIASKNDMYSSVFEIMITCFNAIVAAALARTEQFCFYSVAAGSVVIILPGYIVLCGALELANRSVVSGSVRLVYSLLYTLLLGFGLSAGSEVYQKMSGSGIQGGTDFTCSALRLNAPWYRATIPQWWFFLTIPLFLLCLSLNCKQPFYRRETAVMLIIGGAGYACNFFSARVFVNRPDITSAIGSFVVSMLSNLYAKSTRSSAYIVMLAGTFCQLPSGLANGGLLRFATDSSTAAFSSGISAAQSLVQVVIGTTVGLFAATALVNLLFGGGRRRGANFSSL